MTLQKFDYRSSLYARPNQRWICGWTAEGNPCQLGPDHKGLCRATYECNPLKKGDRWACARSAFSGGRCDDGPLPDGTCCRPIPRCNPVRSPRAKRGLVARWVAVVALGYILFFLGGSAGPTFVLPGDVTFQHAEIADCAGCHTASTGGPTGWVHAAFLEFTEVEDSTRCLACHQLGEDGMKPHSLPERELAVLSERAAKDAAPDAPMTVMLAALAFDPPDRAVRCGACHREHHGREFDLTAMADQRCVACHTVKFASLTDGHPEFSAFPYTRRTRLNFDHVSHIGKHFKGEDKDKAPAACKACHRPDAAGRTMLVDGFDRVCAACHGGQIEGQGRAGAKGVAVLVVPGLDVETLAERNAAIGEWPEDADGEITPFMDLLLAGESGFADARAALAEVDLLDLSEASDEETAAVERVAWAVKELLFDLAIEGMPAFEARIEAAVGRDLTTNELSALSGLLPVDAIRAAQGVWFPALMREVVRHRAGKAVPMPGGGEDDAAEAAPADEAPDAGQGDILAEGEGDILAEGEGDILAEGEGDILADGEGDILAEGEGDILAEGEGDILAEGEGDILAEGEGDILAEGEGDILAEQPGESLAGTGAEAAEEVETEELEELPEMATQEDWAASGGWYREFFSLYYRPTGHADGFLRAWLDFTGRARDAAGRGAAERVFASLSAGNAPGLCVKCHSIDATDEGAVAVNWLAARPVPNQQNFTGFSHVSHFSLLDEKGCLTCHKLNAEADFAAGFKNADPTTFASNFHPLERATCGACHTSDEAGDSCLTCHQYHIGIFPPAVSATRMAGAEAAN